MSSQPNDPSPADDKTTAIDAGAPPREARSSGGCLFVTGILLFVILAALIGTAWLRSRHETPNPALSGRPPQLPAR
ncbi:MAG: hypothetical protein JO276_10180 [Sphingomonadaceae bacterium]|nr:hypothetical protein [Sphingomonadaceae bacterium]